MNDQEVEDMIEEEWAGLEAVVTGDLFLQEGEVDHIAEVSAQGGDLQAPVMAEKGNISFLLILNECISYLTASKG